MNTKYNLSEEVLIALRRIIRAIDLHSKTLVQRYGLTGPQMLILKKIMQLEEVAIGELAKSVSLSQATVTSILDRLEKKDYVIRTISQKDKRKVMVKLTEFGNKVFEKAPSLLQENFVAKFETLEDWEKNLILASLQRIATMMDAKTLDASPVLSSREIS